MKEEGMLGKHRNIEVRRSPAIPVLGARTAGVRMALPRRARGAVGMAVPRGNEKPERPGKQQAMVHDSLVRAMLSDPRRADGFLRHNLPNDIAGLLDGTPPELQPDTFIDGKLKRSQSDLLFKVGLKSGRPAFLFLLLEAKARNDHGTLLQMASYMIRIWRRHAGSEAAKLRALPPIIPMVLYHGREKWTAPTSLSDAVDTSGESALEFISGVRYILRDIRTIPVEEFPPDPEVRTGLIALSGQALDCIHDVVDDLEDDSEFQEQVFRYILDVYGMEALDHLTSALNARKKYQLERKVSMMGMTLREYGEAEGMAKGMVKGRAEGEVKSLTLLLEQRFGPLPRSARDRIAAASIEQLDAWLGRVLEAHSLDELLGEARAA